MNWIKVNDTLYMIDPFYVYADVEVCVERKESNPCKYIAYIVNKKTGEGIVATYKNDMYRSGKLLHKKNDQRLFRNLNKAMEGAVSIYLDERCRRSIGIFAPGELPEEPDAHIPSKPIDMDRFGDDDGDLIYDSSEDYGE